MGQQQQTLWLVKDDPENTWWCTCDCGIVDAPWHDRQTYPDDGGGWLFFCINCRKAFMFARAMHIDQSLEDLAASAVPRTRQTFDPTTGCNRSNVLLATVDDWLSVVRPLAAGLVEAQRYVYFDGRVLPAVAGPIKFRGLWRSHDLPNLPHLDDESILGDPDYWLAERERGDSL